MKFKQIALTTLVSSILFIQSCSKEEASAPPKQETPNPTQIDSIAVARDQAVKNYKELYLSSSITNFTWNGDATTCTAGNLNDELLDKTLVRIKYFRKICGLSNDGLTMEAALNTKCQEASLIMGANNQLSHNPPTTWKCYTVGGAEAAAKGNIAIGGSDVKNIDLWMKDEGSNNTKVGHRRWILFSRASVFGFGCTDRASTLWVINADAALAPLPSTTPGFIAYPPKGFVPKQVVYPRWSLSIPYPSYPFEVNFTNATVTMTNAAGEDMPLTIEYANDASRIYSGDHTIVWRPNGINLNSNMDVKYTVKVKNVLVNGVAKSYEYDVNIINP
jgi:uncharacterized protein YkwD